MIQHLIGLPRGLISHHKLRKASLRSRDRNGVWPKGIQAGETYTKQQVEDSFAESRACLSTTAKVSLTKWGPGDYIIQDNNEDSEDKGPPKCQLRTMKRASKWENYITEDDDDDDDGGGGGTDGGGF